MRRVLTWLVALLALTNAACVTASPPKYRHSGRTTTTTIVANPSTTVVYAPPLPSGTIRIFDLTTTTLDPGITFTRATTAKCVGSNGLLQTFASGTMRTCFDPLTLQPLGALLEEARTNIETHSQDTTSWTTTNATLTNNVAANNWEYAPDGTFTATKLVDSATNAAHSSIGPAVAESAVQYATSVFVKSGNSGGNAGLRYIAVRGPQTTTSNYPWCVVDTSTATAACNAGVTSSRVQQYNNGWLRLGMTSTVTNTGSFGVGVAGSSVATAPATTIVTGPTYAGTSQALYYWGAQIEATSTLFPQESSYVTTTTASVTRNADVASVTGSNFTSWWNQSAGTLCATFTPALQYGIVFEITNVTDGSNTTTLARGDSTNSTLGLRLIGLTGNTGVTQAQINTAADDVAGAFAYLSTPTSYLQTRACYAYGTNDFRLYRDGSAVGAQDTSGTPIAADRLYIGHRNGTLILNGYLAQVEFFSTRRNDTLLASDSTIPTVEYAGAKPGTSTFSTAGYTIKQFVADYGGVCDGVTDNNGAVFAALQATDHTAVHFPTGTCMASSYEFTFANHNNVIWYGDGPDKTILRQTTTNGNSAMQVPQSSGWGFYDMQFLTPNTTARTVTGNDGGLYFYQMTGAVTVQNVYFRNISGASVLVDNSPNVTVNHTTADQSWSDAFHACCGSPSFTVTYSKVMGGSGDDAYASIGYSPSVNTNPVFNDNLAMDSWWGSCVSFEGTTGGTALRNKCYRSGSSGIRLASEVSYASGAVTGALVQDNYLEGVKTRSSLPHGAITMVADGTASLSGNSFISNTIKDPLSVYGFMGITSGGFTVAGTLTNNVMLNTTGNMTTAYSADAGTTFTKSGNLLNGASAP